MKKIFKYIGLSILGIIVLAVGYLGYRYLTLPTNIGTEPSLSVDGSTVFFRSERTDASEFFSLDLAEPAAKQLTHDGQKKNYPVISPDGSLLAFSLKSEGDWYLAVLDMSDQTVELITKTHTFNPVMPTWAGDGKRIFFPSEKEGDRDIFEIDLASGKQTNLTNSEGIDDHVFSNGEWIVFSSERGGNEREIYRMRQDGTSVQRLTNNEYYDGHPSMANDSTIYFLAITENKERYFKKINLDGTGEEILQEFTANIYYPKVRSDGQSIIYVSEQDGGAALFELNLSTRESKRISRMK